MVSLSWNRGDLYQIISWNFWCYMHHSVGGIIVVFGTSIQGADSIRGVLNVLYSRKTKTYLRKVYENSVLSISIRYKFYIRTKYPKSPRFTKVIRTKRKKEFSSWCNSPLVRQGPLIIEASRSHSNTPHSVGLLRTTDQPDTEGSTWQHTTITRDRYPCPRRDSNPPSQQASGCRPSPETAGPPRPGWSCIYISQSIINLE